MMGNMGDPIEMEDDDDVAWRARGIRFVDRVRAELDLSGRWIDSLPLGSEPISLDGSFSPEELETIARIWRETESE